MQKQITIGLLSTLSLLAYGCSISVAPPAQSNQSPAPVTQKETAPNEPAKNNAAPANQAELVKAPETTLPQTTQSEPIALAQPTLPKTTGSRQDRSWEEMGTASTGENVRLSFDSIQVATRSLGLSQPPTYFFQYQIGRDDVYAVTACNGTFSTSKDGDRYDQARRPESAATQKMLDRVCSAWVRTAEVFSPPSHIRMGPKGKIICTIQAKQNITTYGQYEDWFYTDACGKMGLIHFSQIRSS